jgi:LmbE family N-acetylglucosaminyl deacetylase
MKAMAMVAHPDDCVIFAYSYMHNHPEYKWTVCYLTYTETHERGQEFAKFWRNRDVAVKFLGYPDQWNIVENRPGDIDEKSARSDIQSIIADQDLILTHDKHGDYGHAHHVLVNRATNGHPNRIFFAGTNKGTVKYSIDAGTYSLDELPLHQEIVVMFHQDAHTNEYKL